MGSIGSIGSAGGRGRQNEPIEPMEPIEPIEPDFCSNPQKTNLLTQFIGSDGSIGSIGC